MSIDILKDFVVNYLDFDYGVACFIGMLIFGIYILWLKSSVANKRQSFTLKQLFYGLTLSLYIVFILVGTLLSRPIREVCQAEWTVFWTYKEIFIEQKRYLIWQIAYNVLVFVPWGVLFSEIWLGKYKFFFSTSTACFFSIFIEFTQLIAKCGLCEIDDVFHNLLGAILGYGVWKMLKVNHSKTKWKCQEEY